MAKHHGFLEQIATWGYTPCSARFWAMKPAISRCTGSVVQIFFYFQPSSWEDKQNVSNDERDMTVNDNEDLIYLFGGFLYFRGYLSHHPFTDGIFHDKPSSYWGTPPIFRKPPHGDFTNKRCDFNQKNCHSCLTKHALGCYLALNFAIDHLGLNP
jgi:hypothetical protein